MSECKHGNPLHEHCFECSPPEDCFECYPPENRPTVTYVLAAKDKRIAELEVVLEWQPIETAPKDGSKLLTMKLVDGVARCHEVNEWNDPAKTGLGSLGWWKSTALYAPTHWMHLPSVHQALTKGSE